MRDNQYTTEGRIRFSEVDHTRRITLPGIVNYFQDCSTFQSEDLGLGIMHCSERKRAWILSSWQVVVERYPEIGEKIQTSTWATDFKGLFGERNFCMTDENGNDVAYANSLWVYMDIERGRPARPDESEIAPYGTGEPYEMTYESRKIPLPTESEELESFPVRRYHIDTNEHVNNCQYVQMALESLPKDKEVHQMRVEYKKSAVYGDMIYPRIATEDDRTVVELCDEMGFMMMIEPFDEWDIAKCDNGYHRYFNEWAERDMINMLHNYRNNPCVVMWSIGNEVPTQCSPVGYKVAKFLQDICHREDPTRPVTCGMDQVSCVLANGFAAMIDIPGLNYRTQRYKESYDQLPQNLILGSETASTVSSRGVYKLSLIHISEPTRH